MEPVVWMKYNYLILQMASTSISLLRTAQLQVHTQGKRNGRSVFKVLGAHIELWHKMVLSVWTLNCASKTALSSGDTDS
jgi:hypothetical protein